jgi:predicted Holliday junction resolvase-like endonuclease
MRIELSGIANNKEQGCIICSQKEELNMKKKVKEIIDTLITNDFYAECPCCSETISLAKSNLFYSDEFNEKAKTVYETSERELDERRQALKALKKRISDKSEITTRSVNIGFILERMFPSLAEFPYCCEDCRSMFDPVDYLVFEGLAVKGKVERILWVEIKTGGARLNQHQKQIKSLVDGKELAWDVYSPEEHNE